MNGRWFRFYDSALDDPKLHRLSDNLYRQWTKILCLASKNDGKIPKILDDICFSLRLSEGKAREILQALISSELLDDAGDFYVPHNWNARQYKSDVSTERVKRFRERSATVSETSPDQTRTRADTDGKKDFPKKFVVGRNGTNGDRVTLKNPSERLARFQKTLAEAFPKDGWLIVGAASDPSSPDYSRCVTLCKALARDLGKGWPHQWPAPVQANS